MRLHAKELRDEALNWAAPNRYLFAEETKDCAGASVRPRTTTGRTEEGSKQRSDVDRLISRQPLNFRAEQ